MTADQLGRLSEFLKALKDLEDTFGCVIDGDGDISVDGDFYMKYDGDGEVSLRS